MDEECFYQRIEKARSKKNTRRLQCFSFAVFSLGLEDHEPENCSDLRAYIDKFTKVDTLEEADLIIYKKGHPLEHVMVVGPDSYYLFHRNGNFQASNGGNTVKRIDVNWLTYLKDQNGNVATTNCYTFYKLKEKTNTDNKAPLSFLKSISDFA